MPAAMIVRLVLSLSLLWCMAAAAQEKVEMPLWGSDVTAGMAEGDKPVLTVYLPARPCGTAVIMCPGGGYGHLALGHEGHDMAGWFTRQGITYAVLKYRLPHGDRHIPLADAGRAMRIMRGHAAQWGIRPDRVGIMGGSAGGHLAASLSTLCDSADVRPDFTVLLYPVITMEEGITNDGTRDNLLGKNPPQELLDRYSLDRQVTERTPQAFIALSADDGVSPENSIRYFRALRRHGIPAALHIYPSGGHGWGFNDTFSYKPLWTAELLKWLEDITEKHQ